MSRSFDCRWITQFSVLFCVLNGNGQVVTWKLTKNMTFANVEDQLVSLRERLEMQGKNLTEFFIDKLLFLAKQTSAGIWNTAVCEA